MRKNELSPLALVMNELAHNPKVSHCEFRRLVQVAMLPKDGKPSLVGNKISKLTGEPRAVITQILTRLEKMALVKRANGTCGAYEINTNKDEWFPNELSDAEKALQKDLDALEQMKIEILEKFKAVKSEKPKTNKRKDG
jgi:DNA-binding IscR family transcriptional regulator